MNPFRRLIATALAISLGWVPVALAADLPPPAGRKVDFLTDIQPIFQARCYECHGPKKQKADLRLDAKTAAMKGGEAGAVIFPGKGAESRLIQLVAGQDADSVMPPKGDRLSAEQVGLLRAWIDQGAPWPDDASAKADPSDHWAYRPIVKPPVPPLPAGTSERWTRNPIDAFVFAKLREKGLTPSIEADRRSLIRRVSFDLTGLPPTAEEADAFAADESPDAYDKLVAQLLASPRYGERWGRHWLDVVHYGDTHGYDKDKVRPNAWPYRDYVIRSLNEDKPYGQFVREQVAGDQLYKGSPDGVIALGFLAAGPWDFVGQAELREGTIDKAITRNLDRDDMVAVTLNTFASSTAQCARCHNHKFDPISQEDYYSLQAVFAAVDRADRPYDVDPQLAARQTTLQNRRDQLTAFQKQTEALAKEKAGPELAAIDTEIKKAGQTASAKDRLEFGYHSKIEKTSDVVKWVQIDLGKPQAIDRVVLIGAYDTYAGIGAGFGFPVRYRIEASDDVDFKVGVTVIEDRTASDVKNPGVQPQVTNAKGVTARFIRLTATKLAERTADFILALGEIQVFGKAGENFADHATVTAVDSIEAPSRWRKSNLVDGYFYGNAKQPAEDRTPPLLAHRRTIIDVAIGPDAARKLAETNAELTKVSAEIAKLPVSRSLVYAAATSFRASGSFTPTNGSPRPIYLLKRGSEKSPGPLVGPGTIHAISALPNRFNLPADADEADRRAALGNWLTSPQNPLAWRSIVNRVWQYHFGKGIVETTNDFGRMGSLPTHPELLDYLAAEFRDGGSAIPRPQSIKALHRMIVTSATYRQSSADDAGKAKVDGNNQFLWRMNRAKLEAEAIRDTMLMAAGKLDLTMGGPGFRTFGFKDDHSPHYAYNEADPDDVKTHRRSVYRFIVRSVPDPFMDTLDCADPSQAVPKRIETLTALQALALLNDPFTLKMAEHLAARAKLLGETPESQAAAAFRLATSRSPTEVEKRILSEVAQKQGLPAACRVIFNLNEFVFVD